MKKIKLITLTTIVLVVSIFSSCSTDDSQKDIINEDSIATSLNFLKINFNETNKSDNIASKEICIVSWDEWGRKKRNCDGWGLCNAVWFDCNAKMPTNSGAYSSPLYFDNTIEKYYVEILLASSTDIPREQLTLKIDEDFELDTKNVIGVTLIFKQGNYLFNDNLGDFGGIRIYLN